MAESHVVSGLVAKRAEIAGAVQDYQRRIDQLRADLGHMDAAIKICAPDYDLRTLPIKMVRGVSRLFKAGECQRMTLDIMRESGAAMSSRQIALEIIRRKGFESNAETIEQVQKTVIGSINGLILRKIVVQEEGTDGTGRHAGRIWRIV